MTDRKIYQTVESTKQQLDSVSPTFCGAKWTQVLFQLHLGKLHNCCLTPAQPIDQHSLFESPQLVQERSEFLAGNKIKDCKSCWDAEDKGYVSDRVHKSSDPASAELLKSEKRFQTKNIVPTYIEISLSNRCQFKCAYCSPENSSAIYKEISEFGPYRASEDFGYGGYLKRGENFYLDNDENPYVDAFIEWFPKISKEVKVLRFTGGEPLLSHRLFDLLDLLKKYPSPDLELIFNSNLGIQPRILDQFIAKIKSLPQECFHRISFITSIDGWGTGAQLARWGLDLEIFEKNLNTLRKAFPNSEFRFTSTLNVFALSNFKALLEKLIEWKKDQIHSDQILLMAYPLYYPGFLSTSWCRDFFHDEMQDCLNFLDAHFIGNNDGHGFKTVEKDMIEKAFGYETKDLDDKKLLDFTLYLLQHQQRKGWGKDMLPLKVQQLKELGIERLMFNLSLNQVDPVFAFKFAQLHEPSVESVKKLLKPLIKAGSINKYALYDVQFQNMSNLTNEWILWWLEIEEGDVFGEFIKNISPEKRSSLEAKLIDMLISAEEKIWTLAGECWHLKKNFSTEGLKTLEAAFEAPPHEGARFFWFKLRECRNDI